MPKRLLSSLAAAGILISLVACSSEAPSDSADNADSAGCAASGSSSERIEVSGDADATPTVEFPSPLNVTSTERTVVIEGDGDVAEEGSSVTLDIQGFNATNGEPVAALSGDAQQLVLDETTIAPLNEAIICSSVGSRIAAVIPPIEGIEQAGGADIGLTGEDSIVLVIDVNEVAEPVEPLARAEGEQQAAPEGFPTVELGEDGAPTITIPDAEPPAELEIATLILGDGPVVADGDTVTVHYTGVVWATGEVFDSSWERGAPVPFGTDQVISGFGQALVGQTVGSQVIAIIPPGDGYGDTPPSGASFGATDTLVFVADILATQ